jgi:hypothetical protein
MIFLSEEPKIGVPQYEQGEKRITAFISSFIQSYLQKFDVNNFTQISGIHQYRHFTGNYNGTFIYTLICRYLSTNSFDDNRIWYQRNQRIEIYTPISIGIHFYFSKQDKKHKIVCKRCYYLSSVRK